MLISSDGAGGCSDKAKTELSDQAIDRECL